MILRSLHGPDYYDLLRMFVWLMMVSKTPMSEAAEPYSKKPLDYDGSFEFYGMILVAGIALLGVWELLKWIAFKLFGDDEATLAKARRLMKIRNQATRALQEELASMSASSSDPIVVDKPKVFTPNKTSETLAEAPTVTPVSATKTNTRYEDDPDLRAALTTARNGQFQRLRTAFVMSEHGDRVHLVEGCHGLRNSNKAKLKRLQLCYYCDGHFPLSYKITNNQVIPEG